MSDTALMAALGVMLVAAAVVTVVARLLRLPTIVAYLVAGLVVGPLLGILEHGEGSGVLDTIGEMGIVLLMFLVGMELNLERLRRVGRVAVGAGLAQVLLTAALSYVSSVAFGFSSLEAIFLATALTFSSTVVVVKLLDQKGDLHTRYGQIALGILLLQDLVVIIALTLLNGLGSPETLDAGRVAKNIAAAFFGMGGLFAFTLLAARFILPRPFRWASRSPRMMLVWSLAFCFVVVSFAHALSLSPEAGAFLAGIGVAQLGAATELSRRIRPLMSFFIAVFFVWLGAGFDLALATSHGPAILTFLGVALLAKPLLLMVVLARLGESARVAFLSSVVLAQLSEFSLILVAAAAKNELIGPHVVAVVGAVAVSAFMVSSFFLLYGEQIHAFVARVGFLSLLRARPNPAPEDDPRNDLSGHVIVVGMNDLGLKLALELHGRGERVLAVDVDTRRLDDLPCATMSGNVEYEATLEDARLLEAKLVVSALRMASTNALLAVRCQSVGVPIALHVFDRSVAESLAEIDSCFLVQPKLEAGLRVLASLEALGVSVPPEPA